MRIIKYNKGTSTDTSTASYEQVAQQVASLSNQVNGWFVVDENGVLVSSHDIASIGQISSDYVPVNYYDAEIEYLECSGTQFIDTGIVGNLNTTLEISFSITAQQRYIAGCNFDSSKAITLYSSSSANQRFGNKTVTYSYSLNTDYVVKTSKSGLIVNNTNYTRTTTTAFSTEGNLYLMSCNTGSSNGAVGKLYYAKIWDGEVLVRDFVPVRVAQVGYLYDRVTDRVFANAGTGDFVLGNDISTTA